MRVAGRETASSSQCHLSCRCSHRLNCHHCCQVSPLASAAGVANTTAAVVVAVAALQAVALQRVCVWVTALGALIRARARLGTFVRITFVWMP